MRQARTLACPEDKDELEQPALKNREGNGLTVKARLPFPWMVSLASARQENQPKPVRATRPSREKEKMIGGRLIYSASASSSPVMYPIGRFFGPGVGSRSFLTVS
jgi:hypothetical protein